MPNSSEWSYISDISAGASVDLAWRQDWGYRDSNAFFVLLRKPYNMGFRGSFTYFPNDIAGERFGVGGFLQEPLLRVRRHLTLKGDTLQSAVMDCLSLDMGFGLAFYTNPFCRTPNPDNVFIGSYTNCLVQVGLSYGLHLPDLSQISLALRFAHSSNGYLRKPNKGLNYIELSVGYTLSNLNRYPHTGARESRFDTLDKRATWYMPVYNPDLWPSDKATFRGGDLLLSYAPGLVMPRYSGARRKYFYANTARVGYLYRFSPARAAGATLDFTYNFSHTAVIAHHKEEYPLPFYVGLAAAYEASYHRLTIHTALAAYLMRSQHSTTPLYERVGLFYNFGDETHRLRHFVGFSLKSHMAHIDFIEWHYGIRFRTRRQ